MQQRDCLTCLAQHLPLCMIPVGYPASLCILIHVKVTSHAFSSHLFCGTTTLNEHCSCILLLKHWEHLSSFTERKLYFRTYLNCCYEGKQNQNYTSLWHNEMWQKRKKHHSCCSDNVIDRSRDDYLYYSCNTRCLVILGDCLMLLEKYFGVRSSFH